MTRGAMRAVLAALLSHWWRNPVQLAALLVGLSVATALWSGVQALNAEARASYDRAAGQIGGGAPRLSPATGDTLDQADWVALRRAGHDVSPVLEARVTLAGETVVLLGIEPLSLPAGANIDIAAAEGGGGGQGGGNAFAGFVLPPHQTLASPATLRDLGLSPGREARLDDGRLLPAAEARPNLLDGVLVVDIGVAQRLTGQEGRLSYLLMGERAGPGPVSAITAGRLSLSEPETPEDLERLTASFHMNLTAMGLLSFVVGLFIVHAAIGLAFEQRRAMMRTVRAVGVPARALAVALLGEVLILALLAGSAGLIGGYLVAAALLPDVAASLGGLYGAEVPGTLALRPGWFAAGLAMSVAGALAAAGQSLWRAYTMPILESAQPQAWATGQRRWLARQALAAAGVAVAGLAINLVAGGLIAGFGMMAALVVSAALILPVILAAVLTLAERWAAPGLSRWFWADSRQQLSGLSLALMALLLALSVNIGVGTMVGSFRLTFTHWLEGRLAADAYFRAEDPAQARAMAGWLEAQPGTRRVLPNWSVDTRIGDWPVEVYGFADDPLYRERWPLLSALPAPWDRIAVGDHALVSEQLSYRLDLAPGDSLVVESERGPLTVTVAGVYADYGNPRGQLRVDVATLTRHWPGVERLRFGLVLDSGDSADAVARLRETFGIGPDQVQDQAGIRALSLRIFDKTFVVTGALNTLTLGVAGIALLTSLVTLSGLRLPQLAPVWAIGLTRRALGGYELVKMLALALVTAICALPLGLGIAWLLLAVINVEAFGWRLPLHLFPLDWLMLASLAVATAGLAALLPIWRLSRMAPARLIAVFAAAR